MARLTEAIEKYKELSKEKDCLARTFRGFRDYGNPKSTITSGADENQRLSEEYGQVAEWLEELSQYRELLQTPQMAKDLINMNRKHEKNALENAHIVDDYRQKQEQGLLISLPCKVGDKVYIIVKKNISAQNIVRIELSDHDRTEFVTSRRKFHKSEFGKTVFLTRSEAESALAKMGGKE